MNSVYNKDWYWKNMIIKETPLWSNSFKDLDLTTDSIFIYSMIMCKERGILKNSWAYYPDLESLLGFIEHVFMPSAFFTWLDSGDEFKIPIASIDEVLEVMGKENQDIKAIEKMREYEKSIKQIWKESYDDTIYNVESFYKAFNDTWKLNDDKVLYFKIFKTTSEITEFIFKEENGDFFQEIVEEDIGMTKKEWEDICKNLYENKFLRKRFIEILNYKVGCLV